jgi:hypothetical protein
MTYFPSLDFDISICKEGLEFSFLGLEDTIITSHDLREELSQNVEPKSSVHRKVFVGPDPDYT